MDLRSFEQVYGEEGGALYCPALMLKVWLYAYALGVTSARRLEQRIREDLGLRYLAGGARPDNWALSAFRRRHARGLNDVFTQVLEMAREMSWGGWGRWRSIRRGCRRRRRATGWRPKRSCGRSGRGCGGDSAVAEAVR